MLEKNILSRNPYVVTEFGKEYSFYSRKDDSLVGTIEITRNLELISVNLKYESNESQEINLERYLQNSLLWKENVDVLLINSQF